MKMMSLTLQYVMLMRKCNRAGQRLYTGKQAMYFKA